MTMFSVLFVILFTTFAALFLFGMILLKIENAIVPKYNGRGADDDEQGDGKK
jgi:hypothetical protein